MFKCCNEKSDFLDHRRKNLYFVNICCLWAKNTCRSIDESKIPNEISVRMVVTISLCNPCAVSQLQKYIDSSYLIILIKLYRSLARDSCATQGCTPFKKRPLPFSLSAFHHRRLSRFANHRWLSFCWETRWLDTVQPNNTQHHQIPHEREVPRTGMTCTAIDWHQCRVGGSCPNIRKTMRFSLNRESQVG